MPLIATAKAANANAYCTIEEADDYLELRRGTDVSAWTTATDEAKASCIIWATALLDYLCEWEGSPRTFEQALRWPRSGVRRNRDLDWLDYDTVPAQIKDATAEFAFALLQADRTKEPALMGLGFSSATVVGVVSVTVDKKMIRPLVPPLVAIMIGGLGTVQYDANGDRAVRLVRG